MSMCLWSGSGHMRGISLYQSMLHEKLVPHEITSSNLADLMFELGEFYLKSCP